MAESATTAVFQMLQAMQAQQATLQEQVRVQNDAMRSMMSQVNSQTELIRTTIEQDTSSRSRGKLVDTRAIGRPPNFNGKDAEWATWSFKFSTWMSSQFDQGEAILRWAEDRGGDQITQEVLDTLYLEKPSAEELNRQLHVCLTHLMDGGSKAFEIVKNSQKHLGLDAWRRLCRQYDPNNPAANMALLKKVLHPKPVSLDKLMGAH